MRSYDSVENEVPAVPAVPAVVWTFYYSRRAYRGMSVCRSARHIERPSRDEYEPTIRLASA